jgi:peroxiredoxin
VDLPETSKKLHRRLNLDFPLLSDPEMKVIKAYGVAMDGRDIAVPSIFILDSQRRIVWSDVSDDFTDRPGVGEVLAKVPAEQG